MVCRLYGFILMSICFMHPLFADTIVVYNKTDQKIYVALYTQKSVFRKSPANRYTNPVKSIDPDKNIMLERPGRELGIDRELTFAPQEASLKPVLEVQEFNNMTHVNVGDTRGSDFYIAQKEGKLNGYNVAEWKISEPLFNKLAEVKTQAIRTMTGPIKDLIKSQYAVIKDNPYKDKVAQVRMGNDLHPDERAYLKKREPKVRSGLEKLLGHPIDSKKMPVIAFVESGGGYRAMTCCLGWHIGAAKTGLMDAVTYMVGLSGSTWAIGLWLASGLPLEEFAQQLEPLMKLGVKIDPKEFVLLADNFLVKSAFDQELTFVDIFGALLANTVLKNFGDKRQQVRLSAQAELVAKADVPFPIYTAVRGDDKAAQDWYEFTPYEVGGTWLGAYVPTWAFGRRFEKGKSVDFAPEQSFGYVMGTWGSAFAAKFEQMLSTLKSDESALKPPFDTIMDGLLDHIGQERITAARVFNFTAGVDKSAGNLFTKLNLVDGGTAFNLPYPAVSGERAERKADIIIFLDASGGTLGDDLRKVEKYAKDNSLKLPAIEYTNLDKNAVSIFKDENDAAVPLVIYLPRVKDAALLAKEKDNPAFKDLINAIEKLDVENCITKGYCSTFNFVYEPQDFKQLSGLTELNMRASIETIKQAIEWKINQLAGKVKPQSPAPVKPETPAPAPTEEKKETAAAPTVPVKGSNAGDGFVWNNPPDWQVKCTDGAELGADKSGCVCTPEATQKGKKLNRRSATKDPKTGANRHHWTCD